MSIYHNRSGLSRRFRLILTSFLQGEGLPFADVLPEKRIEEAFADQDAEFAEEEDCIYTPAITLWAFLSQVLFKDEQRSCLAAVSRVLVLLVALGREPCDKNSGAYCRARAKLSEPVIRHLTREVAEGCESAVPGKWLWHGRHVLLADGTTASMPDTAENQAEYPQHVAQKPGLEVGIWIEQMTMGTAATVVPAAPADNAAAIRPAPTSPRGASSGRPTCSTPGWRQTELRRRRPSTRRSDQTMPGRPLRRPFP